MFMKIHIPFRRKKHHHRKIIISGIVGALIIGVVVGVYVIVFHNNATSLTEYASQCQQNRQELSNLLQSGSASYGSVVDLLDTFSLDTQYPEELASISVTSQQIGTALLAQLRSQDRNAVVTLDMYIDHLIEVLRPYENTMRVHIVNFPPDVTNVLSTVGCDFTPILLLLNQIQSTE